MSPLFHRARRHLRPALDWSERGPAVDRARREQLRGLEQVAGTRFRDLRLLNLALCHRSYAHEAAEDISNNEKLEFLGDAVLGLVISTLLYGIAEDRSEGELARIKSFVVSEASLHRVAGKLNISDYMLLGRGEEMSGGRNKKALQSDAVEAIIGACYIDSGLTASERFIARHVAAEIDRVLANEHREDYKTLLQELAQKRYKSYPRYRVTRRQGPDHDRTFWIEVELEGRRYGPGRGKNKKEAEQAAAGKAYRALAKSGVKTSASRGAGGADR